MFAPSDPLSFPAVREFTSSVYEKERKGCIDRTRTGDVVSEKERANRLKERGSLKPSERRQW